MIPHINRIFAQAQAGEQEGKQEGDMAVEKSGTVEQLPQQGKKADMKRAVMKILDGSARNGWSKAVEWLITVVVLTNCAAVVIDPSPKSTPSTATGSTNSNSGA